MKNFFLTIVTVLIATSALQASNIGDGALSLIKNNVLSLSLENEAQKSLIISSKYIQNDKCIAIEFNGKLEMIQIYNSEGDIELMFPVASKKVNLGLSLFESGKYKMGFMIDGESEIQFANISIN